jgi:hypothetical protein
MRTPPPEQKTARKFYIKANSEMESDLHVIPLEQKAAALGSELSAQSQQHEQQPPHYEPHCSLTISSFDTTIMILALTGPVGR